MTTSAERPSVSRSLPPGGLVLLLLLTALTVLLGYANKDRCTGPHFDETGRSEPAYQERAYGEACYSDIQHLWVGRDIEDHLLPYIGGGITDHGNLYGGTVEYPVLTGVLIWVSALFAHNDATFLTASAVLMAPFGFAVTWWLAGLRGWRALLWALGPPVVLYAFHNWDLPVIACATAAVFVMHRGRSSGDVPLRRRAVLAAVLLGAGFALKIYPGMFVVPLALYVLTGGHRGEEGPMPGRHDVRGALQTVGAAALTVLVVNLPFAVLGFDGWWASFEFQGAREIDVSTNSVWYWGFRELTGEQSFQDTMSWLSPLLVVAAFAAACAAGWIRRGRTGTFPWVAVSAATLCGFLLLHKVHSPQYTLWLLPFFVLVTVRWGWIVAYFAADAAMGIGIFRWLYLLSVGLPSGIHDGFTAQALVIGVWGRAALLVGLFVAFLSAPSPVDDGPPGRERRAGPVEPLSSGRSRSDPPAPSDPS